MPGISSPDFLALQTALAGRYSIERELGRGGMGVVYLAHEVALDRPVALKLLPPALAVQPGLRERFLREARTAARLSHPNIVPIHAVDEAGEFVFFAMAFVDGETLGERVRARGPLPPAEAARVLRETAWALAYAHAQGVIHRDVKPDNIMLEQGSGRVLVTDFGIAQVRGESGITGAMELVGTAEFMSPEQASGEPLDARSDIYALGCVGYYALSGRLPFQGDDVGSVLAMQIGRPAPALGPVAPEAPAKLTRVVDRCLAKAPADRFASAEGLAEALGQTITLRRDLPIALRVFVKQNRDAYRGSLGAAVMLAVMFGPGMAMVAMSSSFLGVSIVGVTAGAIVTLPFIPIVRAARRLLKAGHGLEDAQLALKEDVDRRREELLFEFGKPGLMDRVLRTATYGTMGVAGVSLAALLAFPGLREAGPVWQVFGLSSLGMFLSGLAYAVRSERRRDIWGERWLKFWKSRFGRWAFRVAGIGLPQVAGAATATYRPTELALGLAADRLYEALPKETRRALPDLPRLVRRLEGDAQGMRRRVEQLNDLVAVIGDASPRPGEADRAALREELRTTRDAAHQKMLDAVAALETIRLGLLRMQAGVATAESITQDLAAARDLLGDLERLAESADEVERALKRPD